MRGKLALGLRHMDERPVPARFKLARHQPVCGGSGIELPEASVGVIARPFEVATERIAHLIPPFRCFLGVGGSRGHSARTAAAKRRFLASTLPTPSPSPAPLHPP